MQSPLSLRLVHLALQCEFQGLSSRKEAIEFLLAISAARAQQKKTIYSSPNIWPAIWGLKDITPSDREAA